MSSEIIDVTEYNEEGFAIIEDVKGKFVMTRSSPELVSIERFPTCYLTRSPTQRERDSMLT